MTHRYPNSEDDALGDEHPEWKRDNGWPVGAGPIVYLSVVLCLAVIAVVAYLLFQH